MIVSALALMLGSGADFIRLSSPVVVTKEYCDTSCQVRRYADEVDREMARKRSSPKKKTYAQPLPPQMPPFAAKQSQSWIIKALPEEHTCEAFADYIGGTRFTLAFDSKKSEYFSFLSNKKWQSLEKDKKYSLSYIVGDITWTDNETLAVQGSRGGLELKSNFDEDFGRQLMPASHVVIRYDNQVLETLSLNGTSKSLPALVRCSQEAYRNAKIDPFAK
ncbi:hypothetical protein [Parasphingorhabdus sp.]|uniref:hypothetical protein n=1 Tax=Parasphingorhabdus sp. TaxID=2709688 RepID=UPI003001B0C9